MSQAWRVLAQNYARFDTPLRPNAETLAAVRNLLPCTDPLVVVLGGTPLFIGLAQRVWFVDVADDALRLVPEAPNCRAIRKNWLAAGAELAQADLIVGDAAVNALDSPTACEHLLRSLRANLKKGGALALRVFVKHELPAAMVRVRLIEAFETKRYSEVRFLVYGIVAGRDGATSVADVDRYIVDLGDRLSLDRAVADRYKADYFDWRGMSEDAAVAIESNVFFPSRTQFESQLDDAGLSATALSAGSFPLAEFTPLYVVTG